MRFSPNARDPSSYQAQLATLVKSAPEGDGWLHDLIADPIREHVDQQRVVVLRGLQGGRHRGGSLSYSMGRSLRGRTAGVRTWLDSSRGCGLTFRRSRLV